MTNEQAVEILKNTTLQFGRANGKTAYIEALNMAIKALSCSEEPNRSDTIYRQDAIDALDKRFDDVPMELTVEILQLRRDLRERIPSAQPEPAIPLSWIEGQIKWLKSLDNAFSTLTTGQISAMVNKWKDEQDE